LEIENDIQETPRTHKYFPKLVEEMKEWNRVNEIVMTREDRTGKQPINVTYNRGTLRGQLFETDKTLNET
jgi:hypothetical protein